MTVFDPQLEEYLECLAQDTDEDVGVGQSGFSATSLRGLFLLFRSLTFDLRFSLRPPASGPGGNLSIYCLNSSSI